MRFEELTGRIIGVCMDVHNELGHGFSETVYHKSLLIALKEARLTAKSEVKVPVRFHGEVVGNFVADIVVEGKVIVEIKALGGLLKDHQAQVINYLNATGLLVGLLVNFGTTRLQHKRLEHPDEYGSRA
ncbi:MAG: GxxExxY protein [Planctomycetes bacterium]|nr:GxxExxY protein [Planctomycetota bacterium]